MNVSCLSGSDPAVAHRIQTSGVLSCTPKPVPPVVTIQSASSFSEQDFTNALILSSLSGTMTGDLQSKPRAFRRECIVGPDLSAAASLDAVSLTVRRCQLILNILVKN